MSHWNKKHFKNKRRINNETSCLLFNEVIRLSVNVCIDMHIENAVFNEQIEAFALYGQIDSE